MFFCVCMCVLEGIRHRFAFYLIISSPHLIWSFWCGQAWTWRPGLALAGLLWCMCSVWLITTWPNCCWTEGPVPTSSQVRPIWMGWLHWTRGQERGVVERKLLERQPSFLQHLDAQPQCPCVNKWVSSHSCKLYHSHRVYRPDFPLLYIYITIY